MASENKNTAMGIVKALFGSSSTNKLWGSMTKKKVYEPPKTYYKKTVQDSIPITTVHEKENLIETYPGFFTRSYWIGENNYQSETEEREEEMYIAYRKVLNSLGVNEEYSLSIMNRNIDMKEVEENVLKKETGDEFDYLRRELNDITLQRIQQGRNGLEKLKYITVGLHCDSVKKAKEVFDKSINRRMSEAFKKIESYANPIPIERKLEIIHDIYNIDDHGSFLTHKKVVHPDSGVVEDVTEFDMDNMRSQGCTIQDVIGPSSFVVFDNHIEMGSKFVRVLTMEDLSATMRDDTFCKLTDVDFNILTTVNYQPLSNVVARGIVHKNLALARSEVAEQRKALLQANLPEDMVSDDLQENMERAKDLREEMVKNDERLFKVVYTIVIWANSMEELQSHTETVTTFCQSEGMTVRIMELMQEEGFNTTLPLLDNEMPYGVKRTMKSSSASIFFPFSNLELMDPGGINYSCNLNSKNLIVYDRTQTQNFNGFVLGKPGCVDYMTEYFNGKEWKRISEYTEGEEVMQFDTETGKASLVIPERYIKEPCETMYLFSGNNVNMKLSEEHRVIYYDADTKEAREISAKDLADDVKACTFRGYLRTGDAPDHVETYTDMKDILVKEIATGDGFKYCFTVPTHALVLRRMGIVFVTGNSGKSFTSKTEMLNVFLGTNSDIIVIDPEGEYAAMTNLIHGQVIKIESGGSNHINPMEIDANYQWEGEEDDVTITNPVFAKVPFIIQLVETMVNPPLGSLTATQKSIIDECVRRLYEPFMDHGVLQPIPPEKMPTLTDLQHEFAKEYGRSNDHDAKELADALKLFTGNGTLNTFGFRSNVDVHNRFITYDIRDCDDVLKPLAMMIIFDSLFNRMFSNKRLGKFTWIWVDEIYLLFTSERSATTLNQMFKRARKHGGVPTGITQNVEDLLESNTARKMLSNCNFVQILNQSPSDREQLRDLLNLSQSQVDVITSAPRGQGLIYTGDHCVPFASTFPKNNSIYRCLTSNMVEIREYEEEERRKKNQEAKSDKKKNLLGA